MVTQYQDYLLDLHDRLMNGIWMDTNHEGKEVSNYTDVKLIFSDKSVLYNKLLLYLFMPNAFGFLGEESFQDVDIIVMDGQSSRLLANANQSSEYSLSNRCCIYNADAANANNESETTFDLMDRDDETEYETFDSSSSKNCNNSQLSCETSKGCDEAATICDFKVKNSSMLIDENEKSSSFCDQCGINFSKRKQLKSHYYDKHYYDMQCKKCNQTFSNRGNWIKHIERHLQTTITECKICHKTFKDPKNLKVHVKTLHASNSLKYECNTCNASFVHKRNYNRHLESHKNIRRFQCVKCSASFVRNDNFKRHMSKCL